MRLLYCRPSGAFAAHEEVVAQLCDEYGAALDFETRAPADAARRLRTWVSATQPTLLVLRDREIVALAVGPLPRLDVDRLIRHALL